MSDITLDAIRTAAARLADAHQVTTARVAMLNDEIREAIAPIMLMHQRAIDQAATDEAAAHTALKRLVDGAPHLFTKPRSLTINGVRAGYKKAEDSLDWDEDDVLVARIKSLLLPSEAELLVRSREELVIDALSQLDDDKLKRLGVRRITGADNSFITIGDSDVEKTAKALIADAMRRQGEDDEPKARKGKAKTAKKRAGVSA